MELLEEDKQLLPLGKKVQACKRHYTISKVKQQGKDHEAE